jgi:hypothetical protein
MPWLVECLFAASQWTVNLTAANAQALSGRSCLIPRISMPDRVIVIGTRWSLKARHRYGNVSCALGAIATVEVLSISFAI